MFYAWSLKNFQRETLFNETISYVTASAGSKILSPGGLMYEAVFFSKELCYEICNWIKILSVVDLALLPCVPVAFPPVNSTAILSFR